MLLIAQETVDEKLRNLSILAISAVMTFAQTLPEFTQIGTMMTIPNESIRCSALDIRLRRFFI